MKLKLIILIILLCSMSAFGATINVPADHAKIQDAINSAATLGDTIIVAPGRFYENLRYFGKNVVVASNYLLSNDPQDILNTIIDGSQYSNVDSAATVVVVDGETSAAELVGFVITGGKGSIIFNLCLQYFSGSCEVRF